MRRVCIIGLGYVGLPLAELCYAKGFAVYGIEADEKKVENLKNSHKYILFDEREALKADVIIIAVPTPISKDKTPDLSYVEAAIKKVAGELDESGRLVILESTVNPFVSRNFVLPLLEESGLKVGKDFYLSHCPERVDPGNKIWEVSNIPRVVGAISNEGLDKVTKFYETILSGKIKPLSSIESAEMVKVYENSFRAVSIAFANEMAITVQNFDLDIKEVIDAVKTKPFGLDLCYPGPGVGGHCIPVDPFYLIAEANKKGFDPRFLRNAMRVNNFMPEYTVQLLTHALNDIGKSVRGCKVGVLGVSYKKNVGDVRESPSLEIIERLQRLGADLKIVDPHVEKYSNASINEVMGSDAVLLLTNHSEFMALDYSNVPVVIDGKNVLDKSQMNGLYRGIGRS